MAHVNVIRTRLVLEHLLMALIPLEIPMAAVLTIAGTPAAALTGNAVRGWIAIRIRGHAWPVRRIQVMLVLERGLVFPPGMPMAVMRTYAGILAGITVDVVRTGGTATVRVTLVNARNVCLSRFALPMIAGQTLAEILAQKYVIRGMYATIPVAQASAFLVRLTVIQIRIYVGRWMVVATNVREGCVAQAMYVAQGVVFVCRQRPPVPAMIVGPRQMAAQVRSVAGPSMEFVRQGMAAALLQGLATVINVSPPARQRIIAAPFQMAVEERLLVFPDVPGMIAAAAEGLPMCAGVRQAVLLIRVRMMAAEPLVLVLQARVILFRMTVKLLIRWRSVTLQFVKHVRAYAPSIICQETAGTVRIARGQLVQG